MGTLPEERNIVDRHSKFLLKPSHICSSLRITEHAQSLFYVVLLRKEFLK